VFNEVRPDQFEKQTPNNQMKEDLCSLRREVVLAQAKAPLQPKQRRQGTRDQQKIIEITMQERGS